MLFQGAHGDAESAPCRLIHQHIGHRQLPDAGALVSSTAMATENSTDTICTVVAVVSAFWALSAARAGAGQAGKAFLMVHAAGRILGRGGLEGGALLLIQQGDHALRQAVGLGDVLCGQAGVQNW